MFVNYKCVRSYFDDLSSHKLGIRITVDADDVNWFAFALPFAFKRSSDLVSKMVGVEWSNGDWDRDDGADSECVLY